MSNVSVPFGLLLEAFATPGTRVADAVRRVLEQGERWSPVAAA